MPIKTFAGAAATPTPPPSLGTREVPDANLFTATGTSQTFNVIPAPGAGSQLRILKAIVTNHTDDLVTVTLDESGAGVQGLNAIAAANGGGFLLDFGAEGWLLGDNLALFMTVASQAAVLFPLISITVLEWYTDP